MRLRTRTIAAVAVLLLVSACGRISEMVSAPIDYESARTLPPLKVPPDLVAERRGADPFPTAAPEVDTGVLAGRELPADAAAPTATGPAVSAAVAPRPQPAPSPEYVRLGLSSDGVSALAVEDSFESVSQQLGRYLTGLDLEIRTADPQQGRYQVATVVPKKGWVRRITSVGRKNEAQSFELQVVDAGPVSLVKLLDASGAPDSSDKGAEIFAALRDEFAAYGRRRPGAQGSAAPRPAPPVAQPKAVIAFADPQPILGRSSDGVPTLALEEGLDSAWQRVGASLDRLGFTIDGRSREQGVYFVQYQDESKKKGFFKRMIPWRRNKASVYQVRLIAAGSTSLVTVADESGAPDLSESGERILGMLRDDLR